MREAIEKRTAERIEERLSDVYVKQSDLRSLSVDWMDDRYVKKDDLFKQWWMLASWGVLLILALANLIARFVT